MFEAIGGRKFIAGLLTVAAGIAVHVMSKAGLTTELAAFLVAMYGAFSAANVAATISALKNGGATTAPSTEETALASRLERIEGAIYAATDPATQEAANAAVQEIKNGIALQNAAITEVLKRIGSPRQ
jgi:hypothetical protein